MPKKTLFIHLGLFLFTLITATIAGVEHARYPHSLVSFEGGFSFNYTWSEFLVGLNYSLPFLLILTCHEFGHYFMAKSYGIKSSLPFYIPMWFPGMFSIGTMGAVIRLKDITRTTKQYFDVGVAGPLAGFVVALLVLFYGFTNLPPKEHMLAVNPDYQVAYNNYGPDEFMNHLEEPAIERAAAEIRAEAEKNGEEPPTEMGHTTVVFGTNLLFEFFAKYVASDPDLVPDQYNVLHYPYLFAGFLALVFTALNLIPIGQLDGGHVLYGLIGHARFKIVSPIMFSVFLLYAGLGLDFLSIQNIPPRSLFLNAILYVGFLTILYRPVFENIQNRIMVALGIFSIQFFLGMFFPSIEGYPGWLIFALLLSRVLGIQHPKAEIEQPLDTKRKVIGWVALIIFVVCVSPQPIGVEYIVHEI